MLGLEPSSPAWQALYHWLSPQPTSGTLEGLAAAGLVIRCVCCAGEMALCAMKAWVEASHHRKVEGEPALQSCPLTLPCLCGERTAISEMNCMLCDVYYVRGLTM